MTRTIGELCRTDRRFAGDFVRELTAVAAKDPRVRSQEMKLGEVPHELECLAEHSVFYASAEGLGRVDLPFDGGTDFTLFVENKLHSGYGRDQLKRYRTALESLPKDRQRRGLVAIARNVPGYGDLPGGADHWLGSVRWTHLLPALRRLQPVSPAVTEQWLLLLEVLEAQGDLGMTAVDTGLVEAWSQYLRARGHLADILDGVWEYGLGVLRRELKVVYKRSEEGLADVWRKANRERVLLQREQRSVWVGYSVPADVAQPAVKVQFDNTSRKARFHSAGRALGGERADPTWGKAAQGSFRATSAKRLSNEPPPSVLCKGARTPASGFTGFRTCRRS